MSYQIAKVISGGFWLIGSNPEKEIMIYVWSLLQKLELYYVIWSTL